MTDGWSARKNESFVDVDLWNHEMAEWTKTDI